MKSCCEEKGEELVVLHQNQGRVLRVVLGINLFMFFLEFVAGIFARSTALMGDSLDMLGDATVYAFSLYVLHKTQIWKARAAFLKGVIIVTFGIAVLVEAGLKSISDAIPSGQMMTSVGILALVANVTCLVMLYRHRDDDVNMRSTFICSRNDIVANVGVIVASFAVQWSGSKWPDIVVGVTIASLFLASSIPILKASLSGLRSPAA